MLTDSPLVGLVDLTGERNRMNGGYLLYGLVGLGIAGASGGAGASDGPRARRSSPTTCEADLNLT